MPSKLFAFAGFFAVAGADWVYADSQCFDGSVQGPNGNDLTKSQVMDNFDAQLQASVASVMADNFDFKVFMESRGGCQHQCMRRTMRSSMSFLFGKYGQEIMGSDTLPIATQALTDAFKACYPTTGVPLQQLLHVVTGALHGVQSNAAPVAGLQPITSHSCPNDARGYEFKMDDMRNEFVSAFQQVVAAHPMVTEFFQDRARSCQLDCIRETVPEAARTLFLNNISSGAHRNESLVLDAVLGAVSACFPVQPRDAVREFDTHPASGVPPAYSRFPGVPREQVRLVVTETIHSMTWPGMDQSCFNGDVHAADGSTLTKSQVLDLLGAQIQASAAKEMAGNVEFKVFMETRGSCQHACMESVLRSSMTAMYGKFGPTIMDGSSVLDLGTEALTGAFKACYPSPPREQVFRVVSHILQDVQHHVTPSADLTLSTGRTCPNAARASEFPMETFQHEFELALRRLIAARPVLQEWFQVRSKTCQVDCVRETVSKSALTLFLNNKATDQSLAAEAFTGAIKACFPGIPREEVNDVVTEVVAETAKVMDSSEAATTFPPETDQSCFTGTIPGPQGDSLTKDQVVERVGIRIQSAAREVMHQNQQFADFMNARGNCQHTCMISTVRTSVATLFGKFGPEVFHYGSNGLTTQALSAAFKACYPPQPATWTAHGTQNLTESVFWVVGRTLQGIYNHSYFNDQSVHGESSWEPLETWNGARLEMNNPCSNQPRVSEFPLDHFKRTFETAFSRVIVAHPVVQEYFQDRAKICQVDCLRETVPNVALTLFLWDDMRADAVNYENVSFGYEAAVGAIFSCFPGVPWETVNDIVQETMDTLQASHGDMYFSAWARPDYSSPNMFSNFYDAKVPSFAALPMFGFAVVMSAALFVTGAAVVRRVRSSGYGSTQQSEENDEEVAIA